MVIEITAFDRLDFRKWLEKNFDRESKVSVILYKKHTGKRAPSHRELMEEAICFGWIDTTIKRIDEDKYMRNFSRRTEKSKWSDNTLGYAKDLIKRGKMTPEGLRMYKLGLEKPVHDFGIPKNPEMPEELKKSLVGKSGLRKMFDDLSPSKRRMTYRWILRGVRKETREKRVRIVIELIGDGKTVY